MLRKLFRLFRKIRITVYKYSCARRSLTCYGPASSQLSCTESVDEATALLLLSPPLVVCRKASCGGFVVARDQDYEDQNRFCCFAASLLDISRLFQRSTTVKVPIYSLCVCEDGDRALHRDGSVQSSVVSRHSASCPPAVAALAGRDVPAGDRPVSFRLGSCSSVRSSAKCLH